MIHQRALTFFGNICRLPDSSIERRIAIRQCSLKSLDSNSWFAHIRKLLIKYDLPDVSTVLYNTPSKLIWNRTVTNSVNSHWMMKIVEDAELYSTLRHMDTSKFQPGFIHPVADMETPSNREVTRLAVKLKIITGTYLLQSNRAAFNQNAIDPTCSKKVKRDKSRTLSV